MINQKTSNFLETLIFYLLGFFSISLPHSVFPSYPPENKEKTHRIHEGNCIPSILPKVHDQVTWREINVILSLEMCSFMIINEGALEGKDFANTAV